MDSHHDPDQGSQPSALAPQLCRRTSCQSYQPHLRYNIIHVSSSRKGQGVTCTHLHHCQDCHNASRLCETGPGLYLQWGTQRCQGRQIPARGKIIV